MIREFVRVMKLQLKGSWNEVKGKLRQKYGQMTDDYLAFAEGKEDELWAASKKDWAEHKDELRAEIEDMCSHLDGSTAYLTVRF